MHPIAEQILAGETVCMHVILEHNAAKIIATERARAEAGPHDPKTCKKKDCTHNMGSDLPYAVYLSEQAQVECTCGRY